MAPHGSLLVSYLYDFPEIDMGTGERRKPPPPTGGERGKGKKKKTLGADESAPRFKRRLLVVPGLTSASTLRDVSAHIYRELRVPATHAELSLLVRSLRRDIRVAVMADADAGGEKPTWSDQMLGELGVVLHPDSAISSATPAFHLRTRIAVKDYAHGGKFFETYREDGGYRRETLLQALSKSWSAQLVIWAFNKHWITRFVLITFAITSLVGLAQQIKDLFFHER